MTGNNSLYTFFRPELRDASYKIGDVYSPDEVKRAQRDWDILSTEAKERYPYLTHVKLLSNTWPHLRLLADFMEVSTHPVRWKDLTTSPPEGGPDLTLEQRAARTKERAERASRTNVTLLQYMETGPVRSTPCKSALALAATLGDDGLGGRETAGEQCRLRLYVVEDLSRDVIEALGSRLDIEPAFFREHIVDYAWCNIRDRWQDPPGLRVAEGHRRWVQMRYVTARYYKTSASFKAGVKESERFNVFRRPDDDSNNKAVWDDKDAKVAITRTRASFWLREAERGQCAVGVLLLDPTVDEGTPLWYGYRNWEPTPSFKDSSPIPAAPPRDSIYSDFIHWSMKSPPASTSSTAHGASANVHRPIQAILYLICSEWLTIADYIRTRIGQIEWEVSFPEHFLMQGIGIDESLKKLHTWRRLVPLYREMLTMTLEQVFSFPCHANQIPVSVNGVDTSGACPCALHAAPSSTTRRHPAAATSSPIMAIRSDFARALSYMEEYQARIDRLTSVVTAIISIEDSRRSQDDNRNVARLTWLATFFVPLSFIAGLFSMQQDVGVLVPTMKLYCKTALPIAVAALSLAYLLTLPGVLKFARGRRVWLTRMMDRVGGKLGIHRGEKKI
ncbi:hypothetical protein BUE80_DR003778 [Diplocarpon rosae]|nr:hypothetical protein BUE80_DR003778 [Diplocarpon rosae]